MSKVVKNTVIFLAALAVMVTAVIFVLPDTARAEQVGAFEVTGGTNGEDYSYENNMLTIKSATSLKIKGDGNATTDRIYVESGVNADITLENVNIDVSSVSYNDNNCAFKIADNSTGNVNLTLVGDNTLKSGSSSAGLQKNSDNSDAGTLTITGTGCFTVTGGSGAAGIGSECRCKTSNIVIDGSNGISIKASAKPLYYPTTYGNYYGAAIGSGIDIENGLWEGIELGLTNSSGESVYLLEIDTEDINTVKIDDVNYPAKHGTEDKIYVYLAAGILHDVNIDGIISKYCRRNNDNNWTLIETALEITATNPDETLVYGTDYTYTDGVLTINSVKGITIKNADGVTETTDRICVASGVNANVTLAGVDIHTKNNDEAAFEIPSYWKCQVKITLADGTENKLVSDQSAGLLKSGSNPLTIDGNGSLYAKGGRGAGIGSKNNSCSNITISGGIITAIGGTGGAGIGADVLNTGSNFVITGGSVKASAEGDSNYAYGGCQGANIGNGAMRGELLPGVDDPGYVDGTEVTPTDGKGNNVYLYEIANSGNEAIEIDGKAYPSQHGTDEKIYVYLTADVHTVKVGSDTKRIIYHNGSFIEIGSDLEIKATDSDKTLVYGTDYTYTNGVLTILSDKAVTISGTTTTDTILVADNVNANITLDNVNIDVYSIPDTCAFKIYDDSKGNVKITLVGYNVLLSGNGCAGLQKNVTNTNVGTLTITGNDVLVTAGNDVLVAAGGYEASGIGSGANYDTANITIESGNIISTGGNGAAGIGGGTFGSCYNITIKGGLVGAMGNDGGAGIGSGLDGSCQNIQISGGSVWATGSEYLTGNNGCKASDIGYGVDTRGYDGTPVTPTSDGKTPVYLLKIANQNEKTVEIDGKDYTGLNYDVIGEVYVLVYLTGEPHTVKVGSTTTNYVFIESESRFCVSVDIPEEDKTVYTYNGKQQTYVLAENDAYEISGNKQTNANTYTVTASLKDTDNTAWSDGTKTNKEYEFKIEQAVPTVTVTANPSSEIAGKTVTVTAAAVNPNNTGLTDIPAVTLTYKVGDGSEIEFTDSFKIPDDTADGTIITVYARTEESVNYEAGLKTATVVTECTHPNLPTEWTSDGTSHWKICPDCTAEVNKEACSGGTATCTKRAVCTVCSKEYGTIDSENHANKESKWSFDGTNHWHQCLDCEAELDKAEHISSGSATATTAETCTECGYVIAPATGESGDSDNNGGNNNSGSSGGHYSGGGSSSGSQSSKPAINGSSKSWSDISSEIQTSANGSNATINLNGNYNVPADVIKAIADKGAKVTFVIDSWRSWTIDGSEIDNPEAVNLTVIQIASLDSSSLRGTAGAKFRIEGANIPAELTLTFKKDYAGKFANLYRKDGDKLVFVDTVKVDANGNAVLTNVSESGDYVVMLGENSDCPGDMDNDGKLTAMDASGVLKYVLGISDSGNFEAADIDGDGKITALDASLILKRVLGLA